MHPISFKRMNVIRNSRSRPGLDAVERYRASGMQVQELATVQLTKTCQKANGSYHFSYRIVRSHPAHVTAKIETSYKPHDPGHFNLHHLLRHLKTLRQTRLANRAAKMSRRGVQTCKYVRRHNGISISKNSLMSKPYTVRTIQPTQSEETSQF